MHFVDDCMVKVGPYIQKAANDKASWPALRAQIIGDVKDQAGPFIKDIEGSIDIGHFVDTLVKKLPGIDTPAVAPPPRAA